MRNLMIYILLRIKHRPLIFKRIGKAERMTKRGSACPENNLILTLEQELIKRFHQDWSDLELEMLDALNMKENEMMPADKELKKEMRIKIEKNKMDNISLLQQLGKDLMDMETQNEDGIGLSNLFLTLLSRIIKLWP